MTAAAAAAVAAAAAAAVAAAAAAVVAVAAATAAADAATRRRGGGAGGALAVAAVVAAAAAAELVAAREADSAEDAAVVSHAPAPIDAATWADAVASIGDLLAARAGSAAKPCAHTDALDADPSANAATRSRSWRRKAPRTPKVGHSERRSVP